MKSFPPTSGSTLGQYAGRLEPIRKRVKSRVAVDTRALAAVRIALATIILLDLVLRARYIRLFYTDAGAYPLAAYESTFTAYNGYSIHALSGDPLFVAVLFLVAGVFAVLLLVGYKTRLVGAISFVLLFSLHARNPALLNGADTLLRLLLFIALLTPIGERWSVDALRRGTARTKVASVGTAALVLQPIVVFTSNAIKKHGGDYWYAGDAIEIAMLNATKRHLLGHVIVDYPSVMTSLNYVWVVLLLCSPLFLLASTGRLRAVAAPCYMGAFGGMMAAMSISLFPLVLMTSVVPFLTAPFWDTLAARVPSHWGAWLPEKEDLGPLSNPPLGRRLLERIRERGYDTVAEFPQSLLTVLSILVLVWMLSFAAADLTSYDVPDEVDHYHLDKQGWGLYAPDPGTTYSWYVSEARLADGSTVEAISGGNVSFDRPPDASAAYETPRHRNFRFTLRDSGKNETTPVIARGYAKWVCDQAVARHGNRVENVTIYRLFQSAPLDGEYEEPEVSVFIERDCRTE